MSDYSQDENGHYEDEIVDAEIVEDFDYSTILNLPPVREDDTQPRRESPERVDGERRQFFTNLLLGGAAALALGGSGALAIDRLRKRQNEVIILPNGSTLDTADTDDLVEMVSFLNTKLVTITAERDELISDLHDKTLEADDARSQLADALALIDEHRAVIELWQRLDNVGLDSVLSAALIVVKSAYQSVQDVVGVVRDELAPLRESIRAILVELPTAQDGITWLGRQVSILSNNLTILKRQMQKAVEPVDPLAAMVAEFVLWVLNRLPFGIGDTAKAGLETMEDIISSLPQLIEGVGQQVVDPLAGWFGSDKRKSLNGILLEPVRDKLIEPASDMFSKLDTFDEAFNQRLIVPVEEKLAERTTIRNEIQAAQARIGMNT